MERHCILARWGSLIREGISRELTNVRMDGIYSPPSSGNQHKWTYFATAKFLVRNHLIDRFNPRDPNASGGHLIIDWSNKTVLNKVMIPYYQCAFTPKMYVTSRIKYEES